MKIGVVMVAYNNAEAIKRLFASAKTENYGVQYYLFLHSMQEDVLAACDQIQHDFLESLPPSALPGNDTWLHYFAYGENRGLAKSWNEGILKAFGDGCETVIIANDDIEFMDGDLTALADCALNQSHHYIVTAQGWSHAQQKTVDMGYSCFAFNPCALDTLGMFDENIFPIYHEDCDYHHRAQVLGLVRGYCAATNVGHGGSLSIKRDDPEYMAQHHLTFTRNKEYFVRKWGGEFTKEVYSFPFNDASFGMRIAPENRHRPYGINDRTDQGIVKR